MTTSRLIAASDVFGTLFAHPGYIPNNWYIPGGVTGLQNGSATAAGSIRAFPGYIMQSLTLSALGCRINTLSAGGNVQLAIYANNPATGRPTGAALASTSSLSTASVASVNGAVSLQASAGLYWFAMNADNGAAVLEGVNSSWAAGIIGSASQSNDALSNTGISGVSIAQTFGTWPNLTSASFSEILGNIPLVQFKVASVP